MNESLRFFGCGHCGNVAALAVSKANALACCGEKMRELAPNTVDASQEKHLPAAEKTDCGVRVKIGSVPHPMTEEHRIDFVCVKSGRGAQFAKLGAGDAPEAEFCFAGSEPADSSPVEAYAYCNLHGLWKAAI